MSLWLLAIVIVYYYGNIWHIFDSLPGILVTNGALQIGTTLIEYANLVFQTWWSKHEALAFHLIFAAQRHTIQWAEIFSEGFFFLLMYLLLFHKLSWRLKTCLVIIQMPNKFLIAPREGIWTYGDTGQCAALNRVWNTLELCSLLYICLLFYLKRWTTPL